jgi:hypothetical protein
MKILHGTLSVVASSLLLAQPAWSADSLAQRIESCAQHPDDAARLSCFDTVAHALRTEHAAVPAPVPAKAVAEIKRSETSRPSPDPAPLRDNPASNQPVTARVISISKTPTLQRRIELDNGQVWQENEHDKSLLLAAGDSVQIQSGALRSFVLRAPSGGSTHVRRVR